MMSEAPWIMALAERFDLHRGGGKAINLARLMKAGFPVPEGFVITTDAFRHAVANGRRDVPAPLAAAIVDAYHAMGSPAVAVRCSATTEDLADASMAGQYETVLDVAGDEAVLQAVRRCWVLCQCGGLDCSRTRSYLQQHHLDPATAAMAVVVQKLVPAEVAGVLFTTNPRTGDRSEMFIEVSRALGDAVVSGVVQPDTFVLDGASGAVKQCRIAEKQVGIEPGSHQQRPLPEKLRKAVCLTPRQLTKLWELGVRVGRHFDSPQDIEWAIRNGKLYLLQSRAATTLEDAESYSRCLAQTRTQLRRWKRAGRGDWVRHNLAAALPHPTPLSWSVVRRFMSGDGGFGAMYREVGFEPSPQACREGVLDLIAGRVYMDLSRGPEMFFEDFPRRYDLDLLRSDPEAAQDPPTIPAGSAIEQDRTTRKLAAVNRRLETLAADCDRKLDDETVPAFTEWVREEKARDLTDLSTQAWFDLWRGREGRVLDTFGPQSLLPGLIAAMALRRLSSFVAEHFPDQGDPRELVDLLSVGGRRDQTLHAGQDLYEVAIGGISVATWLEAHGHRGPEEFDLAAPRWRERPQIVMVMARRVSGGTSPATKHRQRVETARRRTEELAAKLFRRQRQRFRQHVSLVHRYVRFREDGKHYLMMGYDLLRDMALEAGRRLGKKGRLQLGDDVFLLTFDELHDALITGFVPRQLIAKRRAARSAEKRLVLPPVITEDDAATLGEPPC